MPMHPLSSLMNYGVPVSLCSDDPAVFGNMGLTFDFFQASSAIFDNVHCRTDPHAVQQVLVASELNQLSTMGELARRSFKVSVGYA